MHPLVSQFIFACDEFDRTLAGLTHEDANKRLSPSNSIAWMIAHVTSHLHFVFLQAGQGENRFPELRQIVKAPDEATDLADLLSMWRDIRHTAAEFLKDATPEMLDSHFQWNGKDMPESVGTSILRINNHVWYHNGEIQVIRQQLGHTDLPQFVGDLSGVLYQ